MFRDFGSDTVDELGENEIPKQDSDSIPSNITSFFGWRLTLQLISVTLCASLLVGRSAFEQSSVGRSDVYQHNV